MNLVPRMGRPSVGYTVWVFDLRNEEVVMEESELPTFEVALELAQQRQREYPMPKYKVLAAVADDTGVAEGED